MRVQRGPNEPSREWGPGPKFAAAVDSLGREAFPSVFAGVVLQPDGSIAIYAAGTDTHEFVAAVASVASSGVPYASHSVPHSHAFLHALTMQLAADGDSFRRVGVAFGGWGPNVRAGVVSVHLVAPSAEQVAALAAEVDRPVADVSTAYVRVVESLLQHKYGSLITVAPEFSERAHLFSGGAPRTRRS